jgi:quercetin dioxygenase-like cupin family protein
MPITHKAGLTPSTVFSNVSSLPLAGAQSGAVSLTINELVIPPGGAVPLHYHPTHEEAMVVLEGALEATLGSEVATVTAGTTVLAPQQVVHGLRNRSNAPARILAIFPVASPQRVFVEGQ